MICTLYNFTSAITIYFAQTSSADSLSCVKAWLRERISQTLTERFITELEPPRRDVRKIRGQKRPVPSRADHFAPLATIAIASPSSVRRVSSDSSTALPCAALPALAAALASPLARMLPSARACPPLPVPVIALGPAGPAVARVGAGEHVRVGAGAGATVDGMACGRLAGDCSGALAFTLMLLGAGFLLPAALAAPP